MSQSFSKLSHPSHKNQINNLKRIEGQLRGVQRMIEEGDYCIDIMSQIKAIKNSIVSVEGKILKGENPKGEILKRETLKGGNPKSGNPEGRNP